MNKKLSFLCKSIKKLPTNDLNVHIKEIFLFSFCRRIQIFMGMFRKDSRIDGKIVIITGANTGIGLETAIDLAKRGGKIYIACRDVKRGVDGFNHIIDKSGSQNVRFLQMDLASKKSIRDFVKK